MWYDSSIYSKQPYTLKNIKNTLDQASSSLIVWLVIGAFTTQQVTIGVVVKDKLYVTEDVSLKLWHKRLEHMSEKDYKFWQGSP